ncbi:MAG: PH domain-containing protein [Gammaproteobacteria bacterium]|nr:PH domain-containing protein [Gammaproteobacteria bacterium]
MFTKRTEKRLKDIDRVLDENIIDAVSGAVDGKILGKKGKLNGVLVLTSNRVLFYYKKMIGGYQSEEYPLNRISSINFNSGLLGSSIKIHASGNDLEMGWIPKDEGVEDFVKHVKSSMDSPTTNTSMGNQPTDIADQLKKLADLKEQGILTEDEFTTQKAKLLGM